MSEILIQTNGQDEIIGQVVRDEAHAQGLWHRRATVFVFNKNKELLIQKRAPNMSWPNTWSSSASGHVLDGETYEDGARRELKEEIGIECDFKLVGKIIEVTKSTEQDMIDKEHHQLFVCSFDGPFQIQKEELSEVKFESIENIKKKISEDPSQFTPGFIKEFEYYIKNIKIK